MLMEIDVADDSFGLNEKLCTTRPREMGKGVVEKKADKISRPLSDIQRQGRDTGR